MQPNTYPILRGFVHPNTKSSFIDLAYRLGWSVDRLLEHAADRYIAEELAKEEFYGRPSGASMLTTAEAMAEMKRAQSAADSFDAMAHSASKGLADRYRSLARALRDAASEWERVGNAVKP